MLLPVEVPGQEAHPRRGKTAKTRASTSHVIKNTYRRLMICGHIFCRWPLLIFWSLIILFLYYRSSSEQDHPPVIDLNSNERAKDHYQGPTSSKIISSGYLPSPASVTYNNDYHINGQSTNSENQGARNRLESPNQRTLVGEASLVIPEASVAHHQRTTSLLTTKKSSLTEFSRQARANYLDHTRSSVGEPGYHHIRAPSQVRSLIDVLDSHRIGYTIDTTRNGVPSRLLNDQHGKQFPIVVIDNFLKYLKLNRWVRDQLDRHCRTHDIGVVTYMLEDDDYVYQTYSNTIFPYHSLSQRSALDHSSTHETLADEYPFTIRTIHQNCRNESSVNCLVDYQLNDHSKVLRILKRKPNFILPGELKPNSNMSPLVAMSSNHATYEPITWAKLRRPAHRARRSHMKTAETFSTQRQPGHNERKIRASVVINSTESSVHPTGSISSDDEARQIVDDGSNLDALDNLSPFSSPVVPSNDNLVLSPTQGSSTLSIDTISSLFDDDEPLVLAMLDNGSYDGIKRVMFGISNDLWLNRILLLDSIEHLSSGRIITPLDRYIQIDIDDIFVGERGIRMNASDVENLIETQKKFASLIEGGFKFNLGFSGKYFKRGYPSENQGDELLVTKAGEFNWFCHFWSHAKAHSFADIEMIESELEKNLQFAFDKKLPIIGQPRNSLNQVNSEKIRLKPTYAVAPHHSGVYPIHEQLYEAWRDALNVQVTSTEEYPHLRPASGRRAFVHKSIKVLPRQTCGLYTHTIYKSKYPGGFGKLLESINGGELFATILHNPVNIYMTHMSNYANDRLAPYTFGRLIEFVQSNTNLQLKFMPSGEPATTTANIDDDNFASSPNTLLGPARLADYYFRMFPDEREPLWTNPCKDKRHLDIWSATKKNGYCPIAPSLLIVGPQKTGTTALYTFLKLNPAFRSSQPSPDDFEEVQFFNDKHYFNGVDWYFERFLDDSDTDHISNDIDTNDDNIFENNTNDSINAYKFASGVDITNARPSASLRSMPQRPKSGFIYFDKSATYFDDPKVPRRASSLLPEARIIILLLNPADRAYSWYQHVKAHGDPIANSITFDELIELPDEHHLVSDDETTPTTTTSRQAPPPTSPSTFADNKFQVDNHEGQQRRRHHRLLLALRNRCLLPGLYAKHLANWLEYYPSQQITLIDAEFFKINPIAALNRLQKLLRVERPIDYKDHLVFSKDKGFYCHRRAKQPADGRASLGLQCLGGGKGRRYPPMSRRSRELLNRFYKAHNRQLANLLIDIGQSRPRWLEESLMASSMSKRRA